MMNLSLILPYVLEGNILLVTFFFNISSFFSQELLNNKKEKGISMPFTRFVTEIIGGLLNWSV